jgi:hypothetical protein
MIINASPETIGFHDDFREPETALFTKPFTLHFRAFTISTTTPSPR